MSFTELLLLVCFIFGLYHLLRPLQRFIEGIIFRIMGSKNPRIIDATIIEEKKYETKEN